MGIPMLKIRRSRDRLIFNMEIPILIRRHIHIETAPRSQWGIPIKFDLINKDLTIIRYLPSISTCFQHLMALSCLSIYLSQYWIKMKHIPNRITTNCAISVTFRYNCTQNSLHIWRWTPAWSPLEKDTKTLGHFKLYAVRILIPHNAKLNTGIN